MIRDIIITGILLLVILLGGVLIVEYHITNFELLMDEFCQDARETNMSKYKFIAFSPYIKFKCGGYTVIFSSNFQDCYEDEWEETHCKEMQPKKNIWKNMFRRRR